MSYLEDESDGLRDPSELKPRVRSREDAIIKGKNAELKFDAEYANPIVNVMEDYQVVEHKLITNANSPDGFVVQNLGRQPATITVEGIIRQGQVDEADRIGSGGPVYLRTSRWSGTAMVEKVQTTDRRAVDRETWVFDVAVDLLEVEKNTIPSLKSEGSG